MRNFTSIKPTTFEFSLNYQKQNVGIFGNHFVSFVVFIKVTHQFGGKCYLVLINYCLSKELICQEQYKEIKLKLKVPVLPTLCNNGKTTLNGNQRD